MGHEVFDDLGEFIGREIWGEVVVGLVGGGDPFRIAVGYGCVHEAAAGFREGPVG